MRGGGAAGGLGRGAGGSAPLARISFNICVSCACAYAYAEDMGGGHLKERGKAATFAVAFKLAAACWPWLPTTPC